MGDLLLDSEIRLWVVVPIMVITFFFGLLRHYGTVLISTKKKLTLVQIAEALVLKTHV